MSTAIPATITEIHGKRGIDGHVIIEGCNKAAFPSKRDAVIRRNGTYLVRLRSAAERMQLATRPRLAGFFAAHICETDAAGALKRNKDGEPILRSSVHVPFLTQVDRKAVPPRVVTETTIEVSETPRALTVREASFLIGHPRWGLLVEEVSSAGAPVQIVEPKPRKPKGPDGT